MALVASSAYAADEAQTAAVAASATAAEATAEAAPEEILVVGEKRETRLQEAPLAITAVGGAALRERNVNELADVNGLVPGLTVTKSEGAERVIAIRGIGYETAQNPNSQPGVAFHIDGVYIAHVIALNQDMLDVDHIEVLRGPQGTVFGQTSTGGAINVITRKPVLGAFGGEANLSYGNYDYFKGYGTLNIPLGDNLAFRGTVQYLRHNGYGYATEVPGDSHYDLDDADNLGTRASLLWEPNDTLSITLAGQTFDADHNAFLQKCLLCSDDPAAGSTNYIADPYKDPRKVYQDFPGTFETKVRMAYLSISQDIGDSMVAKSVTAYQFLNKYQTGDNDRFAYDDYFDNLVLWQDRSSTWTQEVTLSSKPNSSLEWTVGGFYLRQHALQNILEYSTIGAGVTDPANGQNVNFQTDSPYQHTSWAGYGQGIFHATPELDLIAGLRYSWDKISAQPYQYFVVIPPRSAKSSLVTGKLSLQYKLSPDNMVYATASRGYKPTGVSFNNNSIFVQSTFKKEIVWAAEVGTKNQFFDRTLTLNLSAYHYWYKDFQFTAEDPVPFAGGTANIPRARTYGLEAEMNWLPVKNLRFDGNISLARGRFHGTYYTIDKQTAERIRAETFAALGYPAAYYFDGRIIDAVLAASRNTDGNRIPKLPGVQGSLAATYTADLGVGALTLRGEVIYRGKFNSRIFNAGDFDRVPSYTIGNAYIQFQPTDSMFTFSISATNFTNEDGISNKFADPYGSGTTSVEYINPRQVFGTVSVKF